MKKLFIVTLLAVLLGFSNLAHASLVDNGGGLIYDTDLKITWYDAPAVSRTWDASTTWAASLTVGNTVAGSWRLPTTPATVGWDDVALTNEGEMGHLYYDELKGGADTAPASISPFTNILVGDYQTYWTNTTVSQSPSCAYYFILTGGSQYAAPKPFSYYSLAVHEGNIGPNGPVAPVPIPAALWLFGPGVAGLIGIRRKYKKSV